MSDFSQKLDLRQSQSLVMTPQLQQAIKLLQLNNLEIADLIEEELANNPLLEKQEPEPSEQNDYDSSSDANQDNHAPQEDFDAGSAMADMGSGGSTSFERLDNALDNALEKEKTLRDHLVEQLHLGLKDPRDQMIGALLIDRLDEAGYLREKPENLSERLGCSLARIENLLQVMKGFDPSGIFAGSLEECLALQLEEQGKLDEPMRRLLDNLKLLAAHEHKKLAEICGVNTAYLDDMIAEIRTLNPKPAALFDHVIVQTAIADVIMKKLPKHVGGGWSVELNHETLPRVLVNNVYYKEVAKTATQKKDKEYLSQQLASANWLVKSLDQRAQTILKVAAEIVEQQDAFFNYGIEYLQPLTLKEIADKVGVHESTVSRVTNNKFIGTPRGLFELKYFFSTALVNDEGISHSSQSIKARIKTLIDAENPKHILSDDDLVKALKEGGIDVARRTVAKYREAMKIPSSVQRRKEKRNQI